MKVTAELNGVTVERNIPTSWGEVSYGDMIEISDIGDDKGKALAVFLKMDEQTIRKAKIFNLDSILSLLSFLDKEIEPVVPESVLGYKVPKDLGFEYISQYQDLKEHIKNIGKVSNKEALLNYCQYVAVYACKAKHGHYDWKLAEEMASEFLQAPCTEVMGIGNFTLKKLIGSMINTKQNSRNQNILMKKFRLVLTACRLRLGFLLRSISWLKS